MDQQRSRFWRDRGAIAAAIALGLIALAFVIDGAAATRSAERYEVHRDTWLRDVQQTVLPGAAHPSTIEGSGLSDLAFAYAGMVPPRRETLMAPCHGALRPGPLQGVAVEAPEAPALERHVVAIASAAYALADEHARSDADISAALDDYLALEPEVTAVNERVCTWLEDIANAQQRVADRLQDPHLTTALQLSDGYRSISWDVAEGSSLFSVSCDGQEGCPQAQLDELGESMSEEWLVWVETADAYAAAYETCPFDELAEACNALRAAYDELAVDERTIAEAYADGDGGAVRRAFSDRRAHWEAHRDEVEAALADAGGGTFEHAVERAWVEAATPLADAARRALVDE